MENRKKCIKCGALLPQEASFCPCCTASQLAREPMSPPRSEKRRGALACAVLLVVLLVLLGFFPQPILDTSHAAMSNIQQWFVNSVSTTRP